MNCLALCPNVTFLTKIGSKNTVNYDFVIKKLKKIKLEAIKSSDQPINEKLRYVDKLSNKKLMGLYELDKDKKSFSNNKRILKVLKKISKYDLVIVYDYKHGLIDKTIAKKISSHKNNFINCQVNSSNQNEHNFNDYKNSNCIIINEGELRYELRDNNTDLKKIIRHFARSYNIKNVIITQGSKGAILYTKKINTFFEIPPFANKVIDKVGAGDIILLLTSLFVTVSNDYVLASIIGSMFAAKALENFGNENIVSNAELIKFFSTFLD